MKQSSKIKIYKDVLDTMAEDEPEAQPPQRPRLPITK
jgi:hypothetical protein